MKPDNHHSTSQQAGFTLVEIMVGLAIGMLATVIIMQVFTVFEAQKRTTTGTADAQTNGSIALYTIGRDLQQAGYGLIPFGDPIVADSAIECTTLTVEGTADTPNRLSPVTIGDGSSDTITVRYGDSPGGGIPTPIGAGLIGNDAPVGSNLGCQLNDRVLIVNGGNCAMSTATAVSASSSTVPATVTLSDTSLAAPQVNLACLGTWKEISYSVVGGNLVRAGNPAVAGIVNIQAQYGISAQANSNQITQWVDATGAWATPVVADRNRIKAVRIAVVARNAKADGTAVTFGCSSRVAAAPTGLCAWEGSVASPAPAIDLSADADWQKYRYRVFETIIPLRNVIWSKDTL